ncbi:MULTISPECIES: hypothetical protein [unclassified Mesorhizobium]|uniref:hypothetical protein n=1 Tax=unclassified Mesorhizobium TaxID=325217 RepID=UPI001CCA8C5D|nr:MULTISPECIES: hypothetical protein [unclassified Mesorhizobium]MBZ9698730.1 hypothetical protein [Mesorhizobium sp. CO1-1-9]MBZ9727523.1 hypothetical protein [Mesorhizobium sp. CO1-1-11]
MPVRTLVVEGRTVRLETIPEIIAKKVYYRGSQANPRDIFDIAAAGRSQLVENLNAPRALPEQVVRTKERMEKPNPEFVSRAIAQLMIMPGYEASAADSLVAAIALLDDVLSSPQALDRLTAANNRERSFRSRMPWCS